MTTSKKAVAPAKSKKASKAKKPVAAVKETVVAKVPSQETVVAKVPSQKMQVVMLAAEGKTINEIVEKTGIKKTNVQWYFSKLKLGKK